MPISITDRLYRGTLNSSPFALAYEEDMHISYITVDDAAARDAIPEWRRSPKMICRLRSTDLEYVLGNDITIAGQVWTQRTYGLPDGVVTEDQLFDLEGYIKPQYIRNVFLNDSYIVDSEAEMLALSTVTGNFIVRTDESNVYVKLNNDDPSSIDDFVALSYPASVLSVNGHIGSVVLTITELIAADTAAFNTAVFGTTTITDINNDISSLEASISGFTGSLATKADLVSGTVNVSQMPYTIGNGLTLTRTGGGTNTDLITLGNVISSTVTFNGANSYGFDFQDHSIFKVEVLDEFSVTRSTGTPITVIFNSSQGVRYTSDITATYGTLSLVHKQYVDQRVLGSVLTDPNEDGILFWDDSAGTTTWLSLGVGLSITGTVLSASGGGGGGIDVEEAQDAVGSILSSGSTGTGDINFTYDDVTPLISGVIRANAISFAKMQVIASSRLVGRGSLGSGVPEEILVGNGLVMNSNSLEWGAITKNTTQTFGGFNLNWTGYNQLTFTGQSFTYEHATGASIVRNDASTGVANALRVIRNTTSTAVNGLGVDFTLEVESLGGSSKPFRVNHILTDVGAGVESSVVTFSAMELGSEVNFFKLQGTLADPLYLFKPLTLNTDNIDPGGSVGQIYYNSTEVDARIKVGAEFVNLTRAAKFTTSATSLSPNEGHRNGIIYFTATDPISFNLPGTLSTHFTTTIVKKGTGDISIVPGVGQTLNSVGGIDTITEQYAAVTLVYEGAGVWSAYGVLGDAAGGVGTVTSVDLSNISGFATATGGPITGSGSLGYTLNTQSANGVFAGPTSGGAAIPTFRSIVTDDVTNNAITLTKIQTVATQTLAGRYTTGTGNLQSITLGTGLNLNSTTGVLSSTALTTLTNGEGTTWNSVNHSVDLGGLISGDLFIGASADNTGSLYIGTDGSFSQNLAVLYLNAYDLQIIGQTSTNIVSGATTTIGGGETIKLNVGSDAIGDTYYRDSSGNFVRRAIGTTGQVLTVSGGIPTWGTASIILATGTSGTDVNWGATPISLGGTATLNIPNASTTARGVVTTTTQSFAGIKNFSVTATGSTATYTFTSSITATANSQAMTAVDINPTYANGGFTNTLNYGLLVRSGRVGFGTATPSGTVHIVGTGTTASTSTFLLADSGSSKLLEMLDDGILRIGNAGSRPSIAPSSTAGVASKTGNTLLFNSVGSVGHIFTSSGAELLRLLGGLTASSGNTNVISLSITPTINQTGTASGDIYHVLLNPTLTAVLGNIYGLIVSPSASKNAFGLGTSGDNPILPTAKIHIGAGTATAGTAPIKLTNGVALATAEDGVFEYHSSHLFYTIGSTRYQLDQQVLNGLSIKEGTNTTMGIATLSGGTVVVNTNKVTADSRIFLTAQATDANKGFLEVSTRTAGTSFTILSSNASDTRSIAWIIMEPAP